MRDESFRPALCLSLAALAVAFNLWAAPPAAAGPTYTLRIFFEPGELGVPGSAFLGPVWIAGGAVGKCGSTNPCTFQVEEGAIVTVSAAEAAPAAPGRFTAGTGPAAPCQLSTCTFTMTGPADVTATLGGDPVATITLALAGDGAGTVAIDGARCQNSDPPRGSQCVIRYRVGSVVSLGAAAAPGSRFVAYSAGTGGAAVCGTAPGCQFAITGDATVTATFTAMTAIAVTPATATKPVGAHQIFSAVATYSDGAIQPVPQGAGAWSPAPPLPVGNASFAAVSHDGRIYAIGGLENRFLPSAAVLAFDPATGQWTSRAPMPTKRAGLAAVSTGGFIYALGGNATDFSQGPDSPVVERYDPITNTWAAVAPMPTARSGVAAGVVNGIIYAVGGAAGTAVQTVEAYDPATNTWTPKAAMPTPRAGLVIGVIDGILYAAGGANGTGNTPAVEAYDPATNTWTTRASMPAALGAIAAAVIDDVMYVTGNNSLEPVAYAYRAPLNAWSMKSEMRAGRSSAEAVVLDGLVYVIGGQAGTNSLFIRPSTLVETFVDHVRWSSSVPAVGRVTQQGDATAVSSGTTTIAGSSGAVTCASNCATLTVYASVPTEIALDAPRPGSVVTGTFAVSGWALNRAVPSGTGVDAVHVYAFPAAGAPIFLAAAAYGGARPDVGALFGSQFTNSGFSATAGGGLAPGQYTIVAFARNAGTETFDAAASATVTVSAPVSAPSINIDTPAPGQTVTSAFEVGGWAIDAAATSGTGVDAVHIYIFPNDGAAPPVFIGAASLGWSRPDVGAIYGAQFTGSGFHFTVTGLGPGNYLLAVYGHSTVTGSFSMVKTVHVTVNANALMSIDIPAAEATITSAGFGVSGWAIDRAVEAAGLAGPGVDAVHVYAQRDPHLAGSGPAVFLGVATLGLSRPDVGSIYGARYDTSGYVLNVDRAAAGLTPGVYNIVVWAHSTATNSFNNVALVRVILQ